MPPRRAGGKGEVRVSSRVSKRWLPVGVAAAAFAFLAGCAEDAKQDSLDPQGPISQKIDDLFMPILYIAGVVFVLVMALCVITIVKHRERPGRPSRCRSTAARSWRSAGRSPRPSCWPASPSRPSTRSSTSARSRRATCSRSTSTGTCGGGSTSTRTATPTPATCSRPTSCTSRPDAPSAWRMTKHRAGHPQRRRRRVRRRCHPQLLGAQAGREAGRGPRPGQQAHHRGRRARRLLRPVRRVLQPGPRRHAPPGGGPHPRGLRRVVRGPAAAGGQADRW